MIGPGDQSIEDILASIKRVMTEEQPASPSPPASDPSADDVLELTTPAAAPEPQRALVSPDAAEASRQALAALGQLRLRGGDPADDTLAGLVRELLRPMLKDWLDAHLPAVVERMVVQEIARVTATRE